VDQIIDFRRKRGNEIETEWLLDWLKMAKKETVVCHLFL
jgi:hypothetical protein